MDTMKQHTPNREDLFLNLAIETISLNAIENKVRTVRSGFQTIIRTMNFPRIALRVAAVIIVFVSSATIYKYASVSALSLYNKQFVNYELGTTRGDTKPDLLDFSYKTANWLDVIAINKMSIVNKNKSNFLAGMAEMELKHYPAAVKLFHAVIANKADDGFRDDAEYYAALAYLANHQVGQASALITDIKGNPDHKYYLLALNISPIDLKIIKIKK